MHSSACFTVLGGTGRPQEPRGGVEAQPIFTQSTHTDRGHLAQEKRVPRAAGLVVHLHFHCPFRNSDACAWKPVDLLVMRFAGSFVAGVLGTGRTGVVNPIDQNSLNITDRLK